MRLDRDMIDGMRFALCVLALSVAITLLAHCLS